MIALYDFGNSVACQKVRIALCEKDSLGKHQN